MRKARISDPDGRIAPFEVQFNPNSLEYSVSSNWNNEKGTAQKTASGSRGPFEQQSDPTASTHHSTLSVRLFYHTYKSETSFTDVRDEIEKLRVFVRTSGNTGTNDLRIRFAWGTFSFEGVLDNFAVTYQMFAADGTPVQAEAAVTIAGEDPDYAALADQVKEATAAGGTGEAIVIGEVPLDLEWLFE